MAYPTRYYHHTKEIGRGIAWLSSVYNGCISRVYERWGDMIHWRPQLNDYEYLERYAGAMQSCGFGAGSVWGAVDGTFMGVARPEDNETQKRLYSGYYKEHGLKYQAIATPDGLISHVSEPYLGADNDWQIWRQSGVGDKLRTIMAGHETLYVFGDNAYGDLFGIIPPYRDNRRFRWLSDEQRASNHHLSSARITVEQAFGKLTTNWTYTKFSESLYSASQPVAAYYLNTVFLNNILACFNSTEDLIAKRFNCPPPTIEEYLGLSSVLHVPV